MTTLREAAAQALDALTKIHPGNMSWETGDAWLNAVQILREALAQPEPEPVAIVVAAEYEDGSHAGHRLEWRGRNEANDYPEGTKLYTTPPQHPTETEAEYGSEADTEELLRVGAMPEPLRLAAMLEKTMQWPLHGIAADCLRRMHNEAQRKPLTDQQKLDLVTNWFAEDWAIKKALGLLHDYDIKQAHGIGEKE